jgi:nucleotide-binding universal stress UspA family protein
MKTILVPLDFSDATDAVLGAAGDLARTLGARVVLTHVLRPERIVNEYTPLLEGLAADAERKAMQDLADCREALRRDGLEVESSCPYGLPGPRICEEAGRVAADMVVVGSHGHGVWYDLVIGGTASYLLKRAPCPVLIVPVAAIAGGPRPPPPEPAAPQLRPMATPAANTSAPPTAT